MNAPHAGAWICGIGMMTPAGDCAAQTAASVRAGISRYRESPVYNKRFEPMTLALLPEDALPPLQDELAATPGLTSRQSRMLRLAHKPLLEALAAYPGKERLPLLLAGPETFPGRPLAITDTFIGQLSVQTGANLERGLSRLFPAGRAGGMLALKTGLDLLAAGRDYVLVGGVDSYLDLYLLGTLDSEDRVLASGVMDGFCPGEGAGFLLLCSDHAAERHQPRPAVRLLPPGIASETGHRYSEEPYRGDGLGSAIGLSLNGIAEPIRTILCSLNGENFGAKEWGVAALRNRARLSPDAQFEHPAECFGDTGAAIAPLLIGLAAIGLEKAYLKGPCLTWAASEGNPRGAAVVAASR